MIIFVFVGSVRNLAKTFKIKNNKISDTYNISNVN
jgi:hypothetical protein